MVNADSVHQSAGLEEPKSESPEAENLVYSVPPSNPGTPRDIDHSRVERAPGEATSVVLPTTLDARSVLQKRVNNFTAEDSFGPLLKTAKSQNQIASGGKLSRLSSLAEKSDHKKYKGSLANDPSRGPYDLAHMDAGSSQELPHMPVSKKPKLTDSPIAESPSIRPSFSHINQVAELSKELIDSSRESLSESPMQIAAPVLQPVKPADRYAANSTLAKDAPLEVEEIGPEIRISPGGGLLRGRKSGALLQKEGPANTPIVDKGKDSGAREKRKTPEELLGIERRSGLLGVAEKDPQDQLCMAAKGKSAKTSEAASSETHRPAASKKSKDDNFQAEDIPKGRVNGNRKAPTSDRSASEDTTFKHKPGGDAAQSEATTKDKPSKSTVLAEEGKSQGSKPKGGSQHLTGENKQHTRDNDQGRRAKEADVNQEPARQDAKQPPSRFSSSTPKPTAGKRSSVTSMIPIPRSAKKTPTSGIRTSSISSKDTPSRTLVTNPAKTGPSEITRSSPTEQRRSVTFADDRSDVSQPSVLPGATLINGRAKEKAGTKSVTHKADISKQLEKSSALGRSEPLRSSVSAQQKYNADLFQMCFKSSPQTRLDVTRDKGKQVVRDPPLPPKAARAVEVVDSSDADTPSGASRQEVGPATSKVGPSKGRSTSRQSPANPAVASTKHRLSKLQHNDTTVAKSIQKDKKDAKKRISKFAKTPDQDSAPPKATESSTSFKKDSAEKKAERPLPKSTEEEGIGKSTEQPPDSRGKDATTSQKRNTSLDLENRAATKGTSAETKSQSRSPAKEVFSSTSSSMSETGSGSGSESKSESESEERSPSATNSRKSTSNDAGKSRASKSAKPSNNKTEGRATSSRSSSHSEENEIPLPKPRPQPNPISRNKHKSPKTLEPSTKPQTSHNQTDSETGSDEDSPGRQLQREEKQSSQARITSTTSEVASTSKPPQNGPKTPLATSSSQAPVNSRFQPMSSIAASTAKNTANGQLTTRLPDYKMPLKSPVTPAAKALMDGARDEETSEEESSSSDEDEDEEVEVGKGGGVRGVTRSSQDSGKGGKNSFLDMLKCEYFFVRCLGMLLIVF